jgi:hypothetical protein
VYLSGYNWTLVPLVPLPLTSVMRRDAGEDTADRGRLLHEGYFAARAEAGSAVSSGTGR